MVDAVAMGQTSPMPLLGIMAAPAYNVSRLLPLATDASIGATQVSCCVYDPEDMQWTTVPQAASENPVSASFCSAAFNTEVWRRAQGGVTPKSVIA
ncbi:hypothetical protein MRX96_030692 [Rhipicephalus microplus]